MAASTHYATPPTPTAYPVHVDAVDQPAVSRWLWLVKWLLAIPHYIVLAFLWAAFVVLSVVALVAILVTGRYPRAIFDFNVGVLRWWWRVSYYSYGALATDRYPPFTLAEDPTYPAHLEIDYPEQLSRGLALVKWWLLAIPHYLIVGVLVGGGATVAWQAGDDARWVFGGGLVGLLAIIAAVVVAVTGAYPRPLYDLLLGLNRWVLRVAAYAGLMTDEYPPFRLDQGPHEPGGRMTLPYAGRPAPAPGSPQAPPPVSGPASAVKGSWGAGSVLGVVVGCVAALTSLALVTGGVATLVADTVARDSNGYVMSQPRSFASDGHAVLFEDLQLDTTGASWVPERLIGDVKVTISPSSPDNRVFFGIAPAADIDAFLSGASYSVERGPALPPREVAGTGEPGAPGAVSIWDASASGTGSQSVTWAPENGTWSAVVMNTDGSAAVSADVAIGATFPWLARLGVGLLLAGLVLALGSAALIIVATRPGGGGAGRSPPPPPPAPPRPGAATPSPGPAQEEVIEMTQAWVVYESMFGNTREVAQAVADGLRESAEVEVHEVSSATPLPADLDLLVVGGPTHAFGLSRASSRNDAATKAHRAVESASMGVREWLGALDGTQVHTAYATFDTRVNHPRVPGSAAKKAAKRLRKLGATQSADPESFWVEGTEGPLVAGELDRARGWGRELVHH